VIRQRHPDHCLVLLTETQPAASGYVSSWDVLRPTGWFDEVMFYTPARSAAQRLATMLSLARRIRALGPEMVYDLAPERTGRQARRDRFFFRWLAGVKDYRGGGFLDKPPKNAQGVLPRIEPEWKRLMRVIGAETESIDFQWRLPDDEAQRAREHIEREGIGAGVRMLAVGPGSKMPAKRWPLDRFRELGRRLLDADADLHFLVVGGKEDAVLGEELTAAWGKRSHNLAGRLSVYGTAAALQRCVAYLGNDAGAMHLAGMAGVPCVALFSARDYPGQWEPYGAGHVILRHETDCAGCMRSICPYDNKCLNLISTDEADRAVTRVVKAH
jgi:ADP-heptose:LPS heptosyltransferase